MGMFRLQQILKVISINLALLVAGALLIELVFGSIFFGENYGWLMLDRNVSRTFNVKERYGGTAAGRDFARYVRDEQGLRGDYEDLSRIDILTIGGSTTNQLLIDENETWPARLEEYFRTDGYPVEVVNAGVDGQSTIGHLKNFELWFPKIPGLAPRFVLAYVGINETAYVRDDPEPRFWDLMVQEKRTIRRYLKNNSALYRLYRTIKGAIRAREAMLVHSTPHPGPLEWRLPSEQPGVRATERRYAPSLDNYAARLHVLIQRIRKLGAEAIIVTQHMGDYRIRDGKVFGRVMDGGTVDVGNYAMLMAHNRRSMTVCEEMGAICVDVSRDLIFKDGDHYDFVHTSPQGSAKVARFIYERIRGTVVGR